MSINLANPTFGFVPMLLHVPLKRLENLAVQAPNFLTV